MASHLHCTVRELAQRLSYTEYVQWKAWWGLEPQGDRLIDEHLSQLSAAVLAPHSKSKPKPEKFQLASELRFYSQEQIWRARLQRLARDE